MDLLEKGLSASNFAMLGLGDIVIPGDLQYNLMVYIKDNSNGFCCISFHALIFLKAREQAKALTQKKFKQKKERLFSRTSFEYEQCQCLRRLLTVPLHEPHLESQLSPFCPTYLCTSVVPLTPNIKEQILLSCPHTFLIKVLGRSY